MHMSRTNSNFDFWLGQRIADLSRSGDRVKKGRNPRRLAAVGTQHH
jgi:hypothetical protein